MEPEHRTSTDGHHDLCVACHDGNMAACETLVRLHQHEALRVAFLLTAVPEPARLLAGLAFERALGRPDPGRDFRLHLFSVLGRAFLDRDVAGIGPLWDSGIDPAAGQRHVVENERSRTLAALGRLTPQARLALVLSEFVGFDAAEVQDVFGYSPDDVTRMLANARDRFARGIDLPPGAAPRVRLVDAAFDTPRGNLWPRIEGPLATRHAQRRRRSRNIVAAAVAVVLCLVAVLALLLRDTSSEDGVAAEPASMLEMAAPSPTPPAASQAPAPPAWSVANVPDMLLIANGGQVRSVVPGLPANTPRTVEAGEMPVVSPDGSQLFFVRRAVIEDELRAEIVTLAAEGFSEQWTQDVAIYTGLTAQQHKTFTISLAATDERLYVAWKVWQVTEPVRILAIDRASGEIRERWTVDLSGPITGSIGLFTGPGGSHLHMLALGQWPEAVGRTVYMRFSLPDMQLQRRVDPVGGVAEPYFFFWDSQMLPDGSGLYRVEHDNGFRSVSVRIFDFRSAKARNIDLPFESRAGSAMLFQRAVSNDGHWLYVLAPVGGQLAIIDLARRELDRVIHLDPGPEALPQPDAMTRNLPAWAIGQTMRVSADGTRLYAIGVATENQRLTNRGVWVIDTTTWSIVDRLLSAVEVAALLLHGTDGRIVAVQPSYQGAAPQEVILHHLSVGAQDVSTSDVPAGWWTLATVADLYQRQYGARPAVAGEPPESAPAYSSLPEISIVAAPATIATGGQARLEVRLLDPGSGELIQAGQSSVRHDPDTSLTVILSLEGSDDRIVVLGQAGYGHYQGVARLPDFGLWDARVVLSNGSGQTRQTFVAGVIAVDFPLTGTDGLGYLVRILPEEPVARAGEPVTIRAEIVLAGAGARIAEEVSLYVGMPDEIEVVFRDPGHGVRVKAWLRPAGHGLLTGQVTFP